MSFLALLLAILPAFVVTTTGEEVRPEITRLVTDLDAFVKKDGKEDARAIECVTQLGALYEKCNEKERTAIVKEVGRAFRDPRKRPDKQSHECRLALASAAVLGSMGDAGAKELVPALDLRHFEINGPLLEETIAELGHTRAKSAVEPLLEMAGKRSLFCVRGAARGMANFGEADGAVRKKLFEGLLKPMQSMADEARSDTIGSGGFAKEIFEGARDPAYAALGVLSGGAEPKDIDAWLAWWNNNKNKNWERKKP